MPINMSVSSGKYERIVFSPKENKGINITCGTRQLLSINGVDFEPYDITRKIFNGSVTRNTVDGVKISLKGEDEEYVRSSYHVTLKMEVAEGIMYGLGSHYDGYKCLNGVNIPLYQENLKISIPFFISTAGFGCLINNGSYMRFDNTEKNVVKIYVDCADILEMYVFAGTVDEIHASYREVTGTTPMLPKWAVGYAQSKERYQNEDELLAVVRRYRELKVPLDLVVQDWLYWEDGLWGQKSFDKKRYSDPKSTIDKIHELGAKVMISIWPNMNGDGPDQREFKDKKLMLADGSVYNAFDEKAREVYFQQAYNGLFKYGIDAWWCDSSEPYDANWEGEKEPEQEARTKKSIAEYKKYIDDSQINMFSLYHAKGIYENQRKVSDKRVCNLTRSGFAGQHQFGTITWWGDVSASWNTLEKQVYMLQNYISCGEAYWNSDIGAFFVRKGMPWFWNGEYDKGVEDDAYKELYTRWLQFAAFTPLMRSHGTDTPREIWNFGEPGSKYFEAIKAAIELRYRLVPFFYSVAAGVTFRGIMPVKPLAMAYPHDKIWMSTAVDTEAEKNAAFREYMYGDQLLICPVTESAKASDGAMTMRVYLPEGLWYDFYTYDRYEGGRIITIDVTIDHIPVFAKAGAIIPTVEVMQYVDEKKNAPYEILVFAGADGVFELYDDAGDGYEYENGAYSLIKLQYNEQNGEVSAMQLEDDKFAHEYSVKIIN